ncbi:hypothetical protein D3C86_1421980 [compost metagenome]
MGAGLGEAQDGRGLGGVCRGDGPGEQRLALPLEGNAGLGGPLHVDDPDGPQLHALQEGDVVLGEGRAARPDDLAREGMANGLGKHHAGRQVLGHEFPFAHAGLLTRTWGSNKDYSVSVTSRWIGPNSPVRTLKVRRWGPLASGSPRTATETVTPLAKGTGERSEIS